MSSTDITATGPYPHRGSASGMTMCGAIDQPILEHLEPPTGISRELHEINLLLGTIILQARANFNWLDKPAADVAAAKRGTEVVLQQVRELRKLVLRLGD